MKIQRKKISSWTKNSQFTKSFSHSIFNVGDDNDKRLYHQWIFNSPLLDTRFVLFIRSNKQTNRVGVWQQMVKVKNDDDDDDKIAGCFECFQSTKKLTQTNTDYMFKFGNVFPFFFSFLMMKISI